MLLGAHVSPAGGPANAVARGEGLGCTAIQIFNQSPRMWKGRVYSDEEVAAFHEAMRGSSVEALVIHAVYLINCASDDPEIRAKSLDALTRALRAGDQLGAVGVVLHPGSAKTGHVGEAIARAGEVFAEALAESESCPLHLEDTAGAGGTLGRSFAELAALIDAAGGDERLGVCLDSCHLHASGYDVRTPESLAAVLDELERELGLARLGSLHCNDSQTALGSNRDRHAALGTGELGEDGCATFLSEPRFERLAVIFEGPGFDGKEVKAPDMAAMKALRERGLAARGQG
ncbi:MAG TPA: deoxyribonuclease IV [Solirubrobacteraceae bacterium]|jgi:deoxyribonuclease-4|nr:deoxyribonuclease IV [Solirubrobacteraceae bacterium]